MGTLGEGTITGVFTVGKISTNYRHKSEREMRLVGSVSKFRHSYMLYSNHGHYI